MHIKIAILSSVDIAISIKNMKNDINLKLLYKLMYKNKYISKNTMTVGWYRNKKTSPFVKFSMDMFTLLKNNDIAGLQKLSKEIMKLASLEKRVIFIINLLFFEFNLI